VSPGDVEHLRGDGPTLSVHRDDNLTVAGS
jgi:hypothetical protein